MIQNKIFTTMPFLKNKDLREEALAYYQIKSVEEQRKIMWINAVLTGIIVILTIVNIFLNIWGK